jgi:hypothetical protein
MEDREKQEEEYDEKEFFTNERGLRKTKIQEHTRVSRDIRGNFKVLFNLIFKVFDGFDEKVGDKWGLI